MARLFWLRGGSGSHWIGTLARRGRPLALSLVCLASFGLGCGDSSGGAPLPDGAESDGAGSDGADDATVLSDAAVADSRGDADVQEDTSQLSDASDTSADAGGDATGPDWGSDVPPVLVAPPLPDGPPDFVAENSFLFTGDAPIQTGVAPGALPEKRLAVVHGLARDTAGVPLPGVRTTITALPEVGHTLSRADGRWDLAVPGGGDLVVRFDKARPDSPRCSAASTSAGTSTPGRPTWS